MGDAAWFHMPNVVVRLRDIDLEQVAQFGGKNANLGALLRHLDPIGRSCSTAVRNPR